MRASRRVLAPVLASATLLFACGGHAGHASSSKPSRSISARSSASAGAPGGDWPEFNFDPQRTGVGPANTGITAANVGQLRTRVVHIDGTADSSAVQAHAIPARGRSRDVIVVTTTYGKTIAIDPGTGAELWEYRPPDIRGYEGSSQITTATPLLDPDRRYVYAASPDGRIRKLVLTNGREVRSGHWPVRVTFDATREKVAPALNVSGRSVVVVTGGYYGDAPSYQGHVVMIDRSSGHIRRVWNSLCSNRHYMINPPSSCPASDSAIWARAGAVIEPGSGRILVATGNGPFNGHANWGESVLELTSDAGRLLHNWTPSNQADLSASDTDLGSSAPALLGTYNGYRPVVQGAKDGKLHLLDLNRLNGTRGGPSRRTGGELEEVDSPGGGDVLTAPAVWKHGGRTYAFVADDAGTSAYVLRGRRPHLAVAWHKGTAGTSPVLAGGLLYVYDESDGVLNVYDPTSGRTLASLPASGGHWSSPIVIGGRVILPVGGSTDDDASSAKVYIYHLPGR